MIQGRGVGLGTSGTELSVVNLFPPSELLLMSLFTQAWVLVAASASGGDSEVSARSAFTIGPPTC